MAGTKQRKTRMKKEYSYWNTLFCKNIFAPNLHQFDCNLLFFIHVLVRMERLELSHLAAPEPKSGASTNFATSALCERADYTVFWQNCK